MKKKILFLCTGNSCRSQMAEGWCRYYWSDEFDVYSAGTKKHGLNPKAVYVMKEAGVDISSHSSKTIEELPCIQFDFIVTVCDAANESCPYFQGGKMVHMGFADPPLITKNMTDEEQILKIYRQIRDQIKDSVKNIHTKILEGKN